MRPISVDLETSGLDHVKCGIWQIGAVDLNTKEEFLEESRLDDDDDVQEDALKIIGKTEEELRDSSKQSQKEMLEKFFQWIAKREIRNLLCQNPQFDINFLEIKADKYGLKKTFQFRAFDLHTTAQIVHFNKKGKFHLKENKFNSKKESNMNLKNVLNFCGIEDKRIQTHNAEVIQEGEPHNALEDAKLTAEAFSRLVYGENLLQEYSESKIPSVLGVNRK